MKLYSSPLACSCAVQLIMIELDIDLPVEYVDIYVNPHLVLSDDSSYHQVNPKGSVPALKLESGEVLTEVGVIMQYLLDPLPETSLLPKAGTLMRYRVMEWLSYVGSEVHKTIGQLFNPMMPEEAKIIHRQNLHRRMSYLESVLETQSFLTGEHFTIADAYLYVMIGWKPFFKIDLTPYPNITRYHGNISKRPAVVNLLNRLSLEYEKVKLPMF